MGQFWPIFAKKLWPIFMAFAPRKTFLAPLEWEFSHGGSFNDGKSPSMNNLPPINVQIALSRPFRIGTQPNERFTGGELSATKEK